MVLAGDLKNSRCCASSSAPNILDDEICGAADGLRIDLIDERRLLLLSGSVELAYSASENDLFLFGHIYDAGDIDACRPVVVFIEVIGASRLSSIMDSGTSF